MEFEEIFFKNEQDLEENDYFEFEFEETEEDSDLIRRIEELKSQLEDVQKRKNELIKRREWILNGGIIGSCDDNSGVEQKKFHVKKYFSPYIEKDDISAPQLPSERSVSRFRQEAIISTYFSLKQCEREFTDSEQEIILGQTRSQIIKKNLDHFVKELEELSEEYYRIQDEKISERIQELSLEIEKLKSVHCDLQPLRFDDRIDWSIISTTIDFNQRRSAQSCQHYYNNYLCHEINKSRWSEDENIVLINLYEKYGNDWEAIAKEIGNGRLAWQCCKQYQSLLNPESIKMGKFDKKEKIQLFNLIERSKYSNGEINWNLVRILSENRSLKQIKSMLSNNKNRGSLNKYSKLEDEMIIMGERLFCNNWVILSQYFPERNHKQLRERFANYLNFKARKIASWTSEEDAKLIDFSKKYRRSGHQELIDVAKIQREHFPNRNLHQLYRRYLTLFENGFIDVNPRLKIKKYSGPFLQKLQKKSDERVRIQSNIPNELFLLKEQFLYGHQLLVKLYNDGPRPLTTREMKRFMNNSVDRISRINYECFTENDIDTSLTRFANLCKYRLKTKTNFCDDNCGEILGHALLELIDPSIDKNLNDFCTIKIQQPRTHFAPNNFTFSDCIQFAGQRQKAVILFPFLVDSVRFVLSNFTHGISFDCQSKFTVPFISANLSTLFAYASLQTLSNGIVIQLSKQNDHDKMLEHERRTVEYKNVRKIFFSLFSLPAIMSTEKFKNSKIAQKFHIKEQEESNEQTEEIVEEIPERKRGRPTKRKFHLSYDRFLRVRSMRNFFQMKSRLLDDDLEQEKFNEMLNNCEQFLDNNKWSKTSKNHLLGRANKILEFVENAVIEKQTQQIKQNQNKTKTEKRPRKTAELTASSSSAESSSTSSVLRRSSRSKV